MEPGDVYLLIEKLKALGAREVKLDPPGIGPVHVTFGLPTPQQLAAMPSVGDMQDRILFAHEGNADG